MDSVESVVVQCNTHRNTVQVGTLVGINAVDSSTGKSGAIPVPSISPQKRNGIVVGYSVHLGTEGAVRRQRRFFRHRLDAEKFIEKRNSSPLPIGELWERRAEILYDLERLRTEKTSLTDVVSFFLTNNSRRFDKTVSDVVTEFLNDKRKIGRSLLANHSNQPTRQSKL